MLDLQLVGLCITIWNCCVSQWWNWKDLSMAFDPEVVRLYSEAVQWIQSKMGTSLS